jgi:hypothetical protein
MKAYGSGCIDPHFHDPGTSPPGGTLSCLTRVVDLLHVKEPQAPRGPLSKIIGYFPSKQSFQFLRQMGGTVPSALDRKGLATLDLIEVAVRGETHP